MRVSYHWAMPNKWTFSIKPIAELLSRLVKVNQLWVDPYAGKLSPARVKNDLAGGHEFCMDALDFLKTRLDNEFDGILIDPPYSLRQVSEHYKKAGIKVTSWHTSAGHNSELRTEAARVVKVGGIAISFGWNSTGITKSRNFIKEEIMLIGHGGMHNDTIVTVERKIKA